MDEIAWERLEDFVAFRKQLKIFICGVMGEMGEADKLSLKLLNMIMDSEFIDSCYEHDWNALKISLPRDRDA